MKNGMLNGLGPEQLLGLRIIESPLLVEDGEPYEIPRTWRERLFSWPWRPLRATRTVVSKVPKREAIVFGRTVVVHPAIAAELRKVIE